MVNSMVEATTTLKEFAYKRPLRFFLSVILGITVGVGIGLLGIAWVNAHHSVVVHETRAEYFRETGIIEIHFEYSRKAECSPLSVARGIWTGRKLPNGKTEKLAVSLGNGTASTDDPGEHLFATYKFKKPDEVTPGTWYYHSISADYCGTLAGLFGPIIRNVDDVPVTIDK